jgi:hypothetical protein
LGRSPFFVSIPILLLILFLYCKNWVLIFSQAIQDPEAFAKRVGDLATKAGELASQVNLTPILFPLSPPYPSSLHLVKVTNKAADEEAPLSRANLERTGDELREHSERLVTLANELLENPADSARKKKFEDQMKAIEKGMHAATEPMKEKLSEITGRFALHSP